VNYAFEDPHMRKRFANHGGMAISRNLGDAGLLVFGNESGTYRTRELVARGAFPEGSRQVNPAGADKLQRESRSFVLSSLGARRYRPKMLDCIEERLTGSRSQ
jgi:hypothetical protein